MFLEQLTPASFKMRRMNKTLEVEVTVGGMEVPQRRNISGAVSSCPS